MNKTAIALSLALIAAPALATNTPGADCVGVNACKTNSDNRTTNTSNNPVASVNGVNPEAHAQQQQGQGQTATGGSVGGIQLAPHTSLTAGGCRPLQWWHRPRRFRAWLTPTAALVRR